MMPNPSFSTILQKNRFLSNHCYQFIQESLGFIMQILQRYRNLLIITNAVSQSTRVEIAAAQFASFHSTNALFEKWKNKFDNVSFFAFTLWFWFPLCMCSLFFSHFWFIYFLCLWCYSLCRYEALLADYCSKFESWLLEGFFLSWCIINLNISDFHMNV